MKSSDANSQNKSVKTTVHEHPEFENKDNNRDNDKDAASNTNNDDAVHVTAKPRSSSRSSRRRKARKAAQQLQQQQQQQNVVAREELEQQEMGNDRDQLTQSPVRSVAAENVKNNSDVACVTQNDAIKTFNEALNETPSQVVMKRKSYKQMDPQTPTDEQNSGFVTARNSVHDSDNMKTESDSHDVINGSIKASEVKEGHEVHYDDAIDAEKVTVEETNGEEVKEIIRKEQVDSQDELDKNNRDVEEKDLDTTKVAVDKSTDNAAADISEITQLSVSAQSVNTQPPPPPPLPPAGFLLEGLKVDSKIDQLNLDEKIIPPKSCGTLRKNKQLSRKELLVSQLSEVDDSFALFLKSQLNISVDNRERNGGEFSTIAETLNRKKKERRKRTESECSNHSTTNQTTISESTEINNDNKHSDSDKTKEQLDKEIENKLLSTKETCTDKSLQTSDDTEKPKLRSQEIRDKKKCASNVRDRPISIIDFEEGTIPQDQASSDKATTSKDTILHQSSGLKEALSTGPCNTKKPSSAEPVITKKSNPKEPIQCETVIHTPTDQNVKSDPEELKKAETGVNPHNIPGIDQSTERIVQSYQSESRSDSDMIVDIVDSSRVVENLRGDSSESCVKVETLEAKSEVSISHDNQSETCIKVDASNKCTINIKSDHNQVNSEKKRVVASSSLKVVSDKGDSVMGAVHSEFSKQNLSKSDSGYSGQGDVDDDDVDEEEDDTVGDDVKKQMSVGQALLKYDRIVEQKSIPVNVKNVKESQAPRERVMSECSEFSDDLSESELDSQMDIDGKHQAMNCNGLKQFSNQFHLTPNILMMVLKFPKSMLTLLVIYATKIFQLHNLIWRYEFANCVLPQKFT